jgi:hypothetical protein
VSRKGEGRDTCGEGAGESGEFQHVACGVSL